MTPIHDRMRERPVRCAKAKLYRNGRATQDAILAVMLTSPGLSAVEIGKAVGRDHSTVLYHLHGLELRGAVIPPKDIAEGWRLTT